MYLSPDSINWYGHIAEASEELRQQIKTMRRDGMSPRQFGLYVKAHPERLLITAANKMRAGQKVIVNQNFSGRIVESFLLPVDKNINAENEQLIAKYWRSKFGGAGLDDTGKGWIVRDVEISEIEAFLMAFRTHPDFIDRKNAAIRYLSELSEKYTRGDVLLLSVSANGEDRENYILGAQERSSAQQLGDAWRTRKDRVASRGDEKLGLSELQKDEAVKIAREDDQDKKPSDYHFRIVRKKPLLMLHVLNPIAGDANVRVPAFGLSFPPGEYQTEVEVVANQVWIERMQGSSFDTPDEEDDYD